MSSDIKQELPLFENIDEVINFLKGFTQLLEKENTLLKEMRISEIESLIKNKVVFMNLHNEFESLLINSPEWLKIFPDKKQLKLLEEYEKFKLAIEFNHENLNKAVLVNEHLLKIIQQEVKKEKNNISYDFNGKKKNGTLIAGNTHDNVSITVDKKV